MKLISMKSSPALRRGRKNGTRLLTAATAIVLAAGVTPLFAAEGTVWHVGPTPEVRAICHAADSLWVGTNAGVFVIDIRDASRRTHIIAGKRLASNSVRAIANHGDSVWVATDAGVTLFQHGNARVFSARESKGKIPLRLINHVAFSAKGEVLLSTRRGGVGVLTPKGGYAITRRDSLIDDDVFGILERPGRPRLYACGAGLCAQVNDTTMVSFQAGAGLPRGAVRQVVGDMRAAYVFIARRGVFQFDGMRATSLNPPKGISLTDATSISLGADHALWVAGPGWVWVRRGGKWQQVAVPAGAPASWRVVVADGAGAFAGSADGVVLALNRGAEFRAVLGAGLPAPAVASLSPDGSGNAWFVNGGRVVAASTADRRFAVENSPLDAEAVDFSPSAGLLVASRWTVIRKSETGWTDMTPNVGERDPAFASVVADGGKTIWVGTRSGALYRFDGEIWMRYAQARAAVAAVRDARAFPADDWAVLGAAPMQNVSGNWSCFAGWDSTGAVVDAARSPDGQWLLATRERLFRFDQTKGRWQPLGGNGKDTRTFTGAPGAITAIAFDPAGRLFVGTTDGVGCYTGGKVRWWDVRDGLGGERVSDLAADNTTLWVGYGEDGLSAIPLALLR
jgi:ligand-binding sensor domain-containing protein